MQRFLAVVVLLLCEPAHASEWFDREWSAIVSAVSEAVPLADNAKLRAVRGELLGAPVETLTAREAGLVRYTTAYVDRALSFAADSDEKTSRELLDEAIAQLQRAIELDSRNAEAHALLGSVLGASIRFYEDRARELSQRARTALTTASELEPFNPRVQLLLGSSAYYKPAEHGGGPEKAEPYLRRAMSLFASEPKAKPWPNWGRFDAHILLGQTLEKLQRPAQARVEYEAALALVPRSQYVRNVLLPRTRKDSR